MKLSATARVLSAFADAVETTAGVERLSGLRKVAELLRAFPNLTMSEAVSLGENAIMAVSPSGPAPKHGVILLAETVAQLHALARLCESMAGKSQTNDIRLLINLLPIGQHPSKESDYLEPMLDTLFKAFGGKDPHEEQVADFVAKLKADFGTDRFEATFDAVAASGLKREQVVQIAKQIYPSVAKSTSRKAALAAIRKPHDAYMSAKRGIDAMGGRSAA